MILPVEIAVHLQSCNWLHGHEPRGTRIKFTTSLAIVAATAITIAASGSIGQPASASSRCDALKSEFSSKTRPGFLRIVRRHQNVATYFRCELRRAQSGSTPTRSEIRKAYTKTRGACRNAACKTGAKAVYSAILRLYTVNRRWKNAGCRGYLKG